MALIKCPDCGREVSSRAASCPNCGCPIADIVAAEGIGATGTAAPAAKGESKAERELIVAHLNDLRTLELLKWKYDKPVRKAAEQYGISNYRNNMDLLFKIQDKISQAIISASSRMYSMTMMQYSNALQAEAGSVALMSVKENGKSRSLTAYLYESNGSPDWGLVFDAIKDRYEATFQESAEKKRPVLAALMKAYEANVIPAPFRNLHGVYYLYDYLSTSQESLSDALLHLDLDIIKSKLDTVINQQAEILLQSYITNMQLASMQQKFDELLSTVQSISQDTAAIAKYSAISAAHLETIKILQLIK